MYQFGIHEDRRLPKRSRAPALEQTSAGHELPVIEEKDNDDGAVDASTSSTPDLSPDGTNSATMEEKYIRCIETPSSDAPRPEREILMDKFGFPLLPQPLDDPKDPLTWSTVAKIKILIQISLLSFLSLFTAFAISPAVWPLSKALHVPLVETGYVVGAFVILLGVGPFIWNPLSHSYGRRPIYIIGLVGSLASAIACGLSRRYALLLVFRALNGLFAGAAIGLGTVVCCDIFYTHSRGLYLGIYMVVHMAGGHLAPIIGGYIYKAVNWHWCFYVPAVTTAIFLMVFALAFPETLYSRSVESQKRPNMSEYQKELIRKQRADSRRLTFSNFTRQFKMLKYPSVLIPALFYAVASGYGNMVFVISSAIIFRKVYHFRTWQIGLLLGVPLTLGSFIGEFGAGGFSDWVTRRRATARGGKRLPEDRLYAMLPGVILLPLGLFIEAYSIHNRTHWVGPGLGIAIATAGLQIVTTVTYAYTADCYSRQVGEIGSILNFGRQIFCFCVGFYTIPFAYRFGLQTSWTVFAIVEVACFLPLIALMAKGAEWREIFVPPDWNLDL